MAGLLLCIIAILIGFSYPERSKPEDFSALATVSATLLFAVTCAATGLLASIRLKNGLKTYPSRYRAVQNFVRLKKVSWLMVLGLYAGCIHLFDFPYLVNSENYLGLGEIPLAGSVVVLTPFFLYAAANLAGLYIGDRILRGSSWGLAAYEAFFMRQFLIPVFPFLAFSTAFDILIKIPSLEEKIYVYPWLLTIGYTLFIMILFTFAPLLFRLLWKVERLPDGPLREKVEKMAASNNVKYRDILIWHTGGSNIANAMVTGLFGSMRYVFVTDALLAILPEEEVVAVLAHELGHAKKRHMQIYLLLAVSFIAFINTAEQSLPELISLMEQHLHLSVELLYTLYAFGLLLLFWGVIFGYSSRRFEQAADMFAAKQVSPSVFGSALSRIGFLSGGSRTMSSWRHFSIDDRVNFMEKAAAGEEAGAYRRNMKKAFIVVGIVALLGASAFIYEIISAFDLRSRYERKFLYAYFKKDYSQAVETADNAIGEFPDWARAYYLRAGALDELKDYEKAADALKIAIKLDKQDYFYYQRAEMLIKLDELGEAIQMLEKAIELSPENEDYRKRLEFVKSKIEAENNQNGQIPGDGD